MTESSGSWVFAVILDPLEGGKKDIAKVSSDLPRVRVGRVSKVKHAKGILRKARIRGKRSILEGSVQRYDAFEGRSKLEVGLALERELIDSLRREGYTVTNPPPKANCYVYVIELDRSVRIHRDVRRANPRLDPLKACLYVGQTRRSPEERFAEHSTGGGLKKGGRHLKGKCRKLRPDLFEVFNPMPLLESLILERELADDLRKEGYTVLGGH